MKQAKQIGFITLFIVVLLIGSVVYTTSILKHESEQGNIQNIQLQVHSFSDQITQTLHTIDRTIDNIGLVIEDDKLLQKRISNTLFEYPFIRSINILDDKNTIIKSSRVQNIGHILNLEEFYPKPLFYGYLFRFGTPFNGRYLFEKDDLLSIVPMSKIVEVNQKKYNVVMVISNDYFINKFTNNLQKDVSELQIIRIDGKILFSTGVDFNVNQKVQKTALYQSALNNVFASGIEQIDNKNYFLAYTLTDTFPLCILIKLDYDKVMASWELKNKIALLLISTLIIVIAFVILKLFFKYRRAQLKEIKYQKKLLVNQDKLTNAYTVFENTNDGILITDKFVNIIDVNKAFCKNTGYTKDEIIGKNPNILKSFVHEELFYEDMWMSINHKHSWHGEIINKNKSGELFTELLTINQILDEKGEVKNYIGVFTNITKQKAQELEIKEKERFIFQQSKMASMGEMLENIAHQWRQPLSVISTAATGTKMAKQLGISSYEVEMERLTLINDSAQFLSQTIDDFREFFKPDKQKEQFVVGEVIDKALNIVQSKFRNRNIIVEKEILEVYIKEYKSELIQVLMNILNNARDVIEERESKDRVVFIKVTKGKKNAIISISDSAGGIPEAIIDKLFEPYFTTKHQSQGTGIGLYMSEEIIRKHMRGTIHASNTEFELKGNTYKGAKFTIKIPLVSVEI